jgi:hypothetical protein
VSLELGSYFGDTLYDISITLITVDQLVLSITDLHVTDRKEILELISSRTVQHNVGDAA